MVSTVTGVYRGLLGVADHLMPLFYKFWRSVRLAIGLR